MTTAKLFFKAFLLFIFILQFTSCSNEEQSIPHYKVEDMMWKLGEGDGVEYLEQKVEPMLYTNSGTESIYVSFSETDYIDETSQFYSEDPNLLNALAKNSIKVPITDTETILNSNYGYLIFSRKAPFDMSENILEPTTVTTCTDEVHPNSQVTIEGIIYLKKITASYKAILKDEINQNTIEVEGKWVGVFQNGSNIKFIYAPIK